VINGEHSFALGARALGIGGAREQVATPPAGAQPAARTRRALPVRRGEPCRSAAPLTSPRTSRSARVVSAMTFMAAQWLHRRSAASADGSKTLDASHGGLKHLLLGIRHQHPLTRWDTTLRNGIRIARRVPPESGVAVPQARARAR
jgi:hypothetical protein